MEENKTSLYVSQGEEFWHYEVDVDKATLARRRCVLLPAKVQYVWPHPSRRYLYVTSSDRVRGELGTLHHLTTFSVGADGSLKQVGSPLVLPFRPIHMTVDGAGAVTPAQSNPRNPSIAEIGPAAFSLPISGTGRAVRGSSASISSSAAATAST